MYLGFQFGQLLLSNKLILDIISFSKADWADSIVIRPENNFVNQIFKKFDAQRQSSQCQLFQKKITKLKEQ